MGIFQQFPYSNFHEFNLDQIIKIMREMQDEWEATKTEWDDMKDFINNYFDNLDVSEEVYDALVKMANNGILSGIIDPTIISTTSSWLADHITQPVGVVIDDSLTVSGACADAAATGDAVFGFNYVQNLQTINVEDIETDYYWNTVTGVKAAGAGWSCSKTLIPYHADTAVIMRSTTNYRTLLVCFDEDKNIINGGSPAVAFIDGAIEYPVPVPAGTRYIAVNIHTSPVANMGFTPYDIDYIEYPYTNADIISNYWINGSGVLQSVNNYDCAMMNIKAGEKLYTNQRLAAGVGFFDASGSYISGGTSADVAFYGRVYTAPAGSVYAYVNLAHNATHQSDPSAVFYRITKSEKILCIGDSTTWLDDRQEASDIATRFMGYQKVLERAGYQVTSSGWNGCAYGDDGVNPSIHAGIVDGSYDVTGYDIIILFGGLNDDLYNIPVGSIPTSYQNVTYDTATMLGGLGDIIRYIRANNSTAKIILCTMLKSESTSRPYNEAVLYRDAIADMSKYASCLLCDIFTDLNIQPFTTAFSNNFYDTTHPNKQGMKKVGELMLNAVEFYTK